jgi:hypothetical protein
VQKKNISTTTDALGKLLIEYRSVCDDAEEVAEQVHKNLSTPSTVPLKDCKYPTAAAGSP